MKQMGRILKSYGMTQKQVDALKRWDRVHVIRDLSTKKEEEEAAVAAIKRDNIIEERVPVIFRNHGNNKHGSTTYWFTVHAW